MSETAKDSIREFAMGLGVDDVGFGIAAGYRSPLTPAIEAILPSVKSLVVLAYREGSHCESESKTIAMNGRVTTMEFMKSCNYKLARYLERELKAKAVMTPPAYPSNISPEAKFGLIADFSQRHAAIAAGLGNWGRHNLVIHPKLGSQVLFSTVLTDLDIPPDPPVTESLCNNCNVCVEICGGALDEEGKTDQMKCLARSQPYGVGANIRFWTKFVDSSAEERKKMLRSPEYMSLYQAGSMGLQYFCFNCYAKCPAVR